MITTHVLDTSLGKPAEGVPVAFSKMTADGFLELGRGQTDADGRLRTLFGGSLDLGTYRLVFDTAVYFRRSGTVAFYPEVSVVFEVTENGGHFHVPLLLAPFGYSTYRGS